MVLQKWFRGHLARRIYRQLKTHADMNRSTAHLQECFRAYLGHRAKRRAEAALTIQCCVRRHFASRRTSRLRVKLNNAATAIQACYRGYRVRSLFVSLRSAKVNLSRANTLKSTNLNIDLDQFELDDSEFNFDGDILQPQIDPIGKSKEIVAQKLAERQVNPSRASAPKVKKEPKTPLNAKQVAARYGKRKSAATAIQTAYRTHVCRRHFLKCRLVVVRFQSLWRGYVTRVKHTKLLERRRRAAIRIQSFYRGFCCRRLYSELKHAKEKLSRAQSMAQRRMVIDLQQFSYDDQVSEFGDIPPDPNDIPSCATTPRISHQTSLIGFSKSHSTVRDAICLYAFILSLLNAEKMARLTVDLLQLLSCDDRGIASRYFNTLSCATTSQSMVRGAISFFFAVQLY